MKVCQDSLTGFILYNMEFNIYFGSPLSSFVPNKPINIEKLRKNSVIVRLPA